MNIKSSSYLTVLTFFITVTAVIACKPTDTLLNQNQQAEEWQDITDTGLPGVDTGDIISLNQRRDLGPFIPVDQSNIDTESSDNTEKESNSLTTDSNQVDTNNSKDSQFADDDEQSVAMDKAWIAATEKDRCPKLLQAKMNSTRIVQKNEVMKDSYCDYYIYLNKGKKISVEDHPANIEANLISPVYYDFDNGSYLVKKYDKHVIRLSYDGIEYKSGPIDYNVTIQVL